MSHHDQALKELLTRILRGDGNVVIVEVQNGKCVDLMARTNDLGEVIGALMDAALIYADKSRT